MKRVKQVIVSAIVFSLLSTPTFSAEKGTRRYYLNLCAAGIGSLGVLGLGFVGWQGWQFSRRYHGAEVLGISMLPTYRHKQILTLDTQFEKIERGDVVMTSPTLYEDPIHPAWRLVAGRPYDPGLLKRVVGLPGDEIRVDGYRIYVDGKLLDEPYIRTRQPTKEELSVYRGLVKKQNDEAVESAPKLGRAPTHGRANMYVLGPGEYFLAGDNRPVSLDSRRIGPIHRKHFVGIVVEDTN